jgi:amino acid adenylation domain-containing protein
VSNDVCEVFTAIVAAHADRIAVQTADREVTYLELDRWSDAIAASLQQATAGSDRPAVIFLQQPLATIATILAGVKAGVIIAPLDAEQPVKRLRKLVATADPCVILHDDATAAAVAGLEARDARSLGIVPIEQGAAAAPIKHIARDPDSPAYIFFTSGSTGEPKGILGRHKAIGQFANWECKALGIDQSVRVSQLTNPSFDAILRDLFTPWAVGGVVCVPPARNIIADAAGFAQWLASARVSLLHTIPSTLRILMRALESQHAQRPAALKKVCVAGEPLLPADVARFSRLFGDSVALFNFYGPSETTMIKLFHEVQAKDAERASVPIGKPIDGTRVVILDARQRPVGTGMIGEIYIRTPYRSLGYYKRPDLTAQCFIPNPLSDDANDVVYRTGDLGRMLETGEIEFAGRRDRQVKINGVRVELAEVESLFREHPNVQDVAIVDRQGISGGSELIAYMVLQPRISTDELRRFLLDRAQPGMMPSHFVLADSLPRTASGKLNYAQLPEPDIAADDSPFVAPQTPLEQAVAAIWTDLLQIDPLSIDAHFFRVGGHSLLAMQVLSRVEAAFSVNIPLRDFLVNPTIRGLAELVAAEMLASSDSDDYLKSLLEAS